MQPKANDKTSLGAMRLAFCAGTGYSSPFEVIQAGFKTNDDWVEALDQFRVNNPSHAKPTTTAALPAEVATRKQILVFLSQHCINHAWGLSAGEIAHGVQKADSTIRDLLNDMTEEGLLAVVKVIRGKKGSSQLYRIAGIDEVEK